jgi:hypothetical protein
MEIIKERTSDDYRMQYELMTGPPAHQFIVPPQYNTPHIDNQGNRG